MEIQCSICFKDFSRSDSLKRHMTNVHHIKQKKSTTETCYKHNVGETKCQDVFSQGTQSLSAKRELVESADSPQVSSSLLQTLLKLFHTVPACKDSKSVGTQTSSSFKNSIIETLPKYVKAQSVSTQTSTDLVVDNTSIDVETQVLGKEMKILKPSAISSEKTQEDPKIINRNTFWCQLL